MSGTRLFVRNSLANFLGQLVYPLLSLALVPFYISRLGLESYGLVGFFTALVTVLGLFTKGLSTALTREVARRSATEEGRGSLRSLLVTFERAYWLAGVAIAVVLLATSAFFSGDWLQIHVLSPQTVRLCLFIIAIRITLSFPTTVYYASLGGTQDQVVMNVLVSFMAVWNAICGAIVVWIWRSVVGFYVAELVNAALSTLLLRALATRRLPPSADTGGFRRDYLIPLLRESLGLIWTNGIGGLLTQLDRMVISRILPTAQLGSYVAATAAGRLLSMFYGPLLQAGYPQLCQLLDNRQLDQAASMAVRNARAVAIVCVSVAAPLAAFSADLLLVWTRNAVVAEQGAAVMSFYLGGNVLLAFASVLYQVQMASGQVRFAAWFNTAALVWFPPLLWLLVVKMGLLGAAVVWLVYCAASWLFSLVVTARILPREGWLGPYGSMFMRVVPPAIVVCIGARALADREELAPPLRVAMAVVTGGTILVLTVLFSYGRNVRAAIPELMRAIRPRR